MSTSGRATRMWVLVVAGGVLAAAHVWKVPGALDELASGLGLTLVQSGTLLGIIQVAGMLLGAAVALVTTGIGLRFTFTLGLALLAVGSAVGGFTVPDAPWVLLSSRAVEGVGVLFVSVSGPALIRFHAPMRQVAIAMGWWGAFHGIALFLTVLSTAFLLSLLAWQTWWFVMAALSALLIPLALRILLDDVPDRRPSPSAIIRPINATVRAPHPWILGLVFASYTLQWGAVLGFLKLVFQADGVAPLTAGVLTALVGGVNGLGSIVAGRLLQTGRSPRALIYVGLFTLAAGSTLVFAPDWTVVPAGLAWQVTAALLFSGVGAFVPTTITRIAVDAAPPHGSPAAVVGVITQAFNAASFVGPVVLAWLATAAGGWRMSWLVAVAASSVGAVLTGRYLRRDGKLKL